MGKKVAKITNLEVDEKARVKDVSKGQYAKAEIPTDGRYTTHDVESSKMTRSEEKDI